MLNLLIKTLGLPFYKQHAGLFGILFYLLFGLVNGSALIKFHLALLISICASPLGLLLFFGFFLAYAMKCVYFVVKKIRQVDHNFIRAITILTKEKQMKLWLIVYGFLLFPLLIYGILILITALQNQYYVSFFIALILLFLSIYVVLVYTFKITNYSFYPSKKLINLPQINFNKTFFAWPIFYLLIQQRVMLLGCKIISVLFFKSILWVFIDVGNDIRVYLIAILVVVLSHSILILNLLQFDAVYIGFSKSLSISPIKRFINWFLVFIILLLPEFLLLVVLTDIGFVQLAFNLLFALSCMFLLQMFVYMLKANIDRYIKYLFFLFFLAMFAVLSGYYLIFSMISVAFSMGFFLLKYNNLDLRSVA